MKTKDEFVTRWLNELTGLSLQGFAAKEECRGDMAGQGRWMLQQIRSAKSLLERMHDDLAAGAGYNSHSDDRSRDAGEISREKPGTPLPQPLSNGAAKTVARPAVPQKG